MNRLVTHTVAPGPLELCGRERSLFLRAQLADWAPDQLRPAQAIELLGPPVGLPNPSIRSDEENHVVGVVEQ